MKYQWNDIEASMNSRRKGGNSISGQGMVLSKLTIKARLLLGFSVLIVFLIGLGLNAFFSIRNINHQVDAMATNLLPSVDVAHAINTLTADFRVAELQHIISDDSVKMAETEEKLKQLNTKVMESVSQYESIISDQTDKELIEAIRDKWEDYLSVSEQVMQLSRQLRQKEALTIINGASQKLYQEVYDLCLELVAFNQGLSDEMYRNAQDIYLWAVKVMVCILIVAAALSIFVAVLIIRSITRPIKDLTLAADKLADGDIEVDVHATSQDEIGQLMNSFEHMVENIRAQAHTAEKMADGDMTIDVAVKSDRDVLGNKLHELVEKNNEVLTNISVVSQQVALGAKQFADSSISLAQGAIEQASAVQQLTASMSEIAEQTRHNADNASQANELVDAAKKNANYGNELMKDMLKAMREINSASRDISKIIKVIDEIAFQTKMLSLNAAVEAARAGQHGKGFAVVAEEVQRLAARSANAAKDTTVLIESSMEKVQGGTRITSETASALEQIVGDIEQAALLVSNIAASSNEQAIGIAQVNAGLSQVSEVVQTNSATSEENAAASEALSGHAELLSKQVGRYKLKQKQVPYIPAPTYSTVVHNNDMLY